MIFQRGDKPSAPQRIEPPFVLLHHEILSAFASVPDRVLVEIVDTILLPSCADRPKQPAIVPTAVSIPHARVADAHVPWPDSWREQIERDSIPVDDDVYEIHYGTEAHQDTLV
ncbi:hypothetical protein ACFYXQ_31170 [Nocardia jiangxiensis]|uniref:Uncharacterized protein n=1 Tax=Nocardia jiangxiensis TaxID=282685 RepID=A0ABW6S7I0_9NOCA